MKKRSVWIVSAVALIIVILIVVARSKKNSGVQVAVETVSSHTIYESVTASGKIYPETEIKISPEVSGEIIELPFSEGDSVQRGQLLVRINPAIYNSVVTQASAGVQQSRFSTENVKNMADQSRSQFELAKATFNRNKKLFEDKVISQLEFEQAEASYKGAAANYEAAKASMSGGGASVQAAQANLNQAQENLRKTTIFAPASGIISQLNVKKGERVVGTAQMAGTDVLTIADMSRIEVRVNVSETDIAKVKINDTALVEADAYRNRKFKGIVSKIATSSGASAAQQVSTDQVTNYTVHILILPGSYADLEQSVERGRFVFKPGMSSSVDIQTRQAREAIAVPVNAVQRREWSDSMKDVRHEQGLSGDDFRQVVFVYDPKKKEVALRDVETGLQDNEYIQIRSGLKAGEQVVTAPYGAIARTLTDHAKVTVVKKDALFSDKSDK